MKRLLAAFAIAICLGTAGCTIAGTAIGANMPRYEAVQWPKDGIEIGREVRVRVRAVGEDAIAQKSVDGRFAGIHDGVFLVTTESGETEIPLGDVRAVYVRDGTEWKKGLLLGAVADVCATVLVVAIATNANVSVATSGR